MKIHLLLLTTIVALFLGCDSGVKPDDPDPVITAISSGVAGTVTFTGQWPAKATEVRLVTSKVFPPEMDDIIYGKLIPMDTSTYDYEFELEPGTYKLVGLAWRNEGADWNFPSICSFYFSKDDSLAPASLTVKDDKTVVTSVDITVDRSKARIVSDAKITGKVTFSGNWPEKFTEARVIATTKFDIRTLELPTANDLTFSKSIANGSASFDYEIPAYPGNFRATFVIFFAKDEKLSDDNVFYSSDRGGLDMAEPGEISYAVELDQTVKGPDFSIVF